MSLLGLGTADFTFVISIFWTKPRMPRCILSAFDGSPADSATNTSPLGNASSQRGCSRPVANRLTVNPAGA